MSPSRVNFGQIESSAESQRKTVKITRGDGGPLALELVPLEHANVQASLREIEPGERYELDIDLRPPWPKNRYVRADLKLKTGVSQASEESIRVYATIAQRLRANPALFRLQSGSPTESEKTAKLIWSGGEPGNVLEVTCSDPELSVRLEEGEEDGRQAVVLRVPAGYSPKGQRRAVVTVKTDDPEALTLRIPVTLPRPLAPVRASPSRLVLPQGMGNEVELKSRLLWADKPGKVLEAKSSDEQLSVRVEENENQQYVVVHVPAGYTTPPNVNPFVTVRTDSQRVPILRIRLVPARPSPTKRIRPTADRVSSGVEPPARETPKGQTAARGKSPE